VTAKEALAHQLHLSGDAAWALAVLNGLQTWTFERREL
jgi:hypothetical protein